MLTQQNETERAADKAATKEQVANFFQVSTRTVDTWIRDKRIPFWKIARTVRFDLDAVKSSLNAKAAR